MGKKLTTLDFITKAIAIHGNRYDYSKVIYTGNKAVVQIICHKHGEFAQTPNAHTHSTKPQGCPQCGLSQRVANRTKTQQEYIIEANNVHDNFYDYGLVKYNNAHSKIDIICPVHGVFSQSANNHLTKKQGCPRCAIENHIIKQTDNIDSWMEKVKQVHGDWYDYSKAVYTGSSNKLTIICPIHGEFQQQANTHRQGGGCIKCGYRKTKNAKLLTQDQWIADATLVQNGF